MGRAFECGSRGQARRAQRWQHRTADHRRMVSARAKSEDAPVRGERRSQSARTGSHHRDQAVADPLAKSMPTRAAIADRDQRLGEELTDDPRAAGSYRQPHGDLALAGDAAGEEQVGGAGARDGEEQPDEREEHAAAAPRTDAGARRIPARQARARSSGRDTSPAGRWVARRPLWPRARPAICCGTRRWPAPG